MHTERRAAKTPRNDIGCLTNEISITSFAFSFFSRRATELAPSKPGHALRLMHSLELRQAYNEVLDVAAHFCRAAK